MPRRDREWAARFRTLQPDWELVLWTDNAGQQQGVPHQDIREFNPKHIINADCVCAAEEMAPRSSLPAIISDLFRLEILAQYGGVYVDTDYYPVTEWDHVVSDCTLFASEEFGYDQQLNRCVGNFIIGSVPGHPALWHAIRECRQRIDAKLSAGNSVIYPVDDTGPNVIRDVFGKYADATIFPFKMFSPWNGYFAPPVQIEDIRWHPAVIGAHMFLTRWSVRTTKPYRRGDEATLPTWMSNKPYGDKTPWVTR